MPRYSLEACVLHACSLELLAPKPGNVHRGAGFEDVTFGDFLQSAIAIAEPIARANQGVGEAIFQAVHATRNLVGTNTNLGIILLLAPLAAVPRNIPLHIGLPSVLTQLTPADAEFIWRAIQYANPGGLGSTNLHDVQGPPPANILEAMQLAAQWDRVAAQYADNFQLVFNTLVPWLEAGRAKHWPLSDVIVHAYLQLLAVYPDTLIARKTSMQIAEQASHFAHQVLSSGMPGEADYYAALSDFDFWLRSDGHRRNPGTTADLVVAGLFVLLREDRLLAPLR